MARAVPQSDPSGSQMNSMSRLWSSYRGIDDEPDPPTFVRRDLLIGKALLIYWPHAWRRPIPLLPNFRRMGLIR